MRVLSHGKVIFYFQGAKEGQSILALTLSQLPIIQNNQYANTACFRVTYSETYSSNISGIPKLCLYSSIKEVFNKKHFYGNKRKQRLMIEADYKKPSLSPEGSQ